MLTVSDLSKTAALLHDLPTSLLKDLPIMMGVLTGAPLSNNLIKQSLPFVQIK